MKLKKTLVILALIALPGQGALANSQHFSEAELKNEAIFRGEDNKINLTVPGGEYSALDAYLMPSTEPTPADLKAITPVYTYHLLTEENKQKAKAETCQAYLKNYLGSGRKNTSTEIKKLQQFLQEEGGFAGVQLTGKYDKITIAAVSVFQETYFEEILKPWDLSEGNGQVYKSTLTKINQLVCASQQERQSKIKISYSYFVDTATNALPRQAKAIYFLNKPGEWQALNSTDDHKRGILTAFTPLTSLTFVIVEEPSQWIGEASWYAYKNGNFAASRDFSKGTKVKVTSVAGKGKSIIVIINDYGPELQTKRLIDLDKAAFQQLGALSAGVMSVKIEILKASQ